MTNFFILKITVLTAMILRSGNVFAASANSNFTADSFGASALHNSQLLLYPLVFICLAVIVAFVLKIRISNREKLFHQKLYAPIGGRTVVCSRQEKILYRSVGNDVDKENVESLSDIKGLDYKKISSAIKEVFDTGKRKMFDYDYNGNKRVMTISPLDKSLYGEDCVVWYSQDNSELQDIKKIADDAVAELKKNTQMWNILLNGLPVHIFAKNPDDDFRYVFVNKCFADFMNKSREEMLGKTDFDIFPYEHAKSLRDSDVENMKDLVNRIETTYSITNNNGERRKLKSMKQPFVSSDGGKLLLGTAMDITELDLTKSNLEDSIEMFNLLMNSVPNYILAKDVDNDFRYTVCNKSFAAMLNKSPEEVIGCNDAELFCDNVQAAKFREWDLEAVNTGSISQRITNFIDPNGISHVTHAHWILCKLSGGRRWLFMVVDDVSALYNAKKEAEENAEWFKLTLNSIGDGVITTDADGKIVLINPVGERMMGCSLKDAVGRPHEEFFHIVSYINDEPMSSPITRSLRTGNTVELANHTDLISSSGRRYHISDSASPIKDHDGKIIGGILVFRDVSEEYESRDKLRAAIMSLEAGSKMMQAASFTIDPETRTVTGSKYLPEHWPVRDEIAVNAAEWIYHEDLEAFRQKWYEMKFGKAEEISINYRVLKNNKMRYYRLYAGADRSNRHAVRFSGVVQDITDIMENDEKLRESRELWNLVSKYIPLSIFVKDAKDDFKYILVNKRLEEFFGMEASEIVGRTDADILKHEEIASEFRDWDSRIIAGGKPVEFLERAYDTNDKIRHLRTTKIPFKGVHGEPLILGVSIDITELNRMIENEKAVNDALKKVLQTNDFYTNLEYVSSHLRTLMNCHRVMFAQCNDEGLLRLKWEWHSDDIVSIMESGIESHYKMWDLNIGMVRENKAIVINDLQSDPICSKLIDKKANYKIKSMIAVPVFIEGALWGMLFCSFAKREDLFSQSDEKLMRSMANIIALAQVSERKNKALQRVYFEKQVILNNISIPIWLYDSNGRLLRTNNAVAELTGVALEELSDEKNREIFASTLAAGELTVADLVVLYKKIVQREFRFREREYIVTGEPVFDDEGRFVYVLKNAVDVTQMNDLIRNQKLVNVCLEILYKEDDIKQAIEVVLRTLAEHFGASRSYVLQVDYPTSTESIFSEYCARGGRKIFDKCINVKYDTSEPWFEFFERGEPLLLDDFSNPDDLNKLPSWRDFIRENNITGAFIAGIKIDGKLWGDIGVVYEHKRDKKISQSDIDLLNAFAKFVELMLSRKRSQERLIDALKRAQAADKAKSFFIASVSHEIRTPLNSVIGFSELLQQGGLDATTQKDYINSIAFSGNALLQLINDVLDLSKLEADQMTMLPESVNLCVLGEEMMTLFKFRAIEEGNILEIDIDKSIPSVLIDKLRLRQILFNLIGNAVKFTSGGRIVLSAKFNYINAYNGDLEISVSDTGIGISDEDLKKLMQPFVQLSKLRGTNARNNGTGLGLSISKRLAEKMGGNITIQSRLGEGSTFKVEFKNITVAQQDNSVSQSVEMLESPILERASNMSVLLVDDVDMNLKVMKALCNKVGLKKVTLAKSGAEALEAIKVSSFDLILTDIWMPEINGAQLAAKIREDKRFASVPIFAITADMEASVSFPLEDFSGVLLKPITLDKVKSAIYSVHNSAKGTGG